MAAEGGNIVRFTYTGADGEWIDVEATHILVQARVIRREAFDRHRNIVEVICDEDVKKIEKLAFWLCPRLRRVIMPNVKIVEEGAFDDCAALEDVECDKLEIVGRHAFFWCDELRSINLPSARIVVGGAFVDCEALTDVKFGSKLERIEEEAFWGCYNLERITIPLKDGLFTEDDIFMGCRRLHRVDLVDGELHEIIAALHLDEWRNDMNEEIDSINQILPRVYSGRLGDPGLKTEFIRRWIRSVLDKITRYQAEHRRLLEEDVAAILHCELPVAFSQDIVMKNVLPFLELPSYTFEVVGRDEHDDN